MFMVMILKNIKETEGLDLNVIMATQLANFFNLAFSFGGSFF